METLLVKIDSKSEASFISELLKKLGVKTRILKEEELEDLGLIKMMKEADRSKKVSR
jgi:hypothetical protein